MGRIDLTPFKIISKSEKKATTLNNLFRMWLNFLYDKILTIFKYKGLPFPQRELESIALISGINYAAFHNKEIGVVTGSGSVYGVTRYPDIYTNVVYAMPTEDGSTISGDRVIGVDAVVLYNTSSMMGFYPFLARYASLLAHIDLTLKCGLVNLRDMDTFVTMDSATKETIEHYYNEKYEGRMSAIIDETMLMKLDGNSTLNLANGNYHFNPREIVDVQLEVLRQFYRDIGVRWIKDKRANINSEEVDSDEQLLLFNISDMLQCRKDFCEEYNRVIAPKLGGKTISVDLSPEFKLIHYDNKEGVENDNKENDN